MNLKQENNYNVYLLSLDHKGFLGFPENEMNGCRTIYDAMHQYWLWTETEAKRGDANWKFLSGKIK